MDTVLAMGFVALIFMAFLAVVVGVGLWDAHHGVTSNEDMMKKDGDKKDE